MALISPEDYKKKKGIQAAPSVHSSGLISPQEYKDKKMNTQAAKQKADPTINSDLLQQEKLSMIHNNPKLAPAANMPKVEIAPKVEKKLPALAQIQKDIYNSVIAPIQDKAYRFAAHLTGADAINNYDSLKNNAPSFLTNIPPVQRALRPAQNLGDKITNVAGDLAGFIAPGEAAYATGGKLAVKGLAKLAPNAPKIVSNLARGAGAGLAYGVGAEGLDAALGGNKTLGQRAANVGLDAALFGAGDAALPLLAAAAKRILSKYIKPTPTNPALALPEGRLNQRLNIAGQRGVNAPGLEPISNPFTHTLPEASSSLIKQTKNISEAKNDLASIEQEMKQLQGKYDAAVVDQYKFLKESMNTRGGVEQGNLIRDVNGDITGRTGRISHNPEWFQQFHAENGRAPTNKDLLQLAKEHVDNGFQDSGVTIPSWKSEHQYDETFSALNQVKNEISKNLPRGNVTGSALKQTKLSFPVKPKVEIPKVEPMNAAPKEPPIDKPLNIDGETVDPRVRDKVVSYMEQQGNAARERLKSRRNTLNSNPLPEYADYAIIGAEHIVKGAVKLADFTEAMVKEFGQEIKPHIQEIYNQSKVLAKQNVKLTKDEYRKQQNLETFAKNNQVAGLPDTSTHIVSKTTRESTNFKDAANVAYIKSTDNLHRMRQFTNDYKSVKGELSSDKNAYELALNSRNSDQISHQIITHNLVDSQGNVIGDSLKEIMKPIRGKKKYQEFMDYLVNKHADTRMQRGENVFPPEMHMSPEKSREIAKMYETKYPEFQKVGQQIYEFNDKLGQAWLVDAGMITQEEWNGYLKANPYYVPNNRLFSELEKPKFQSAKKGYANQSNPIKAAKGGVRPIVDPIESMIEHVAIYVKTAKQNEVMQTLVEYLQHEPKALEGWAEVVGKEPAKTAELLNENGVDAVIQEINQTFEKALQKPDLTKGNVVFATVNGEKVHIQVHDAHLLDAIAQLPKKSYNPIVNVFAQVTRMMKVLTTGVNPVFSLTRNIFRDIPTAYINSKSTNNPVKFAYDLVDSFVNIVGNKDLYQSYKNMGGGHSSSIAANRNLLAQSKRKVIPQHGILPTVQKGFNFLENLNNAIETAPRLAEYKRLSGGDYASKVKALFEANDVTVNFNKFGTYSKQIDAFIPYFNAAVQGLDKFVRVYNKNQLARTMVKSVGAITVPSVLLYAYNHDNPNYKKLSNYVKDNYFVFPVGDKFVKIPKPREIGVPFGSMVERVLREWNDNDPQAFKDFAQTIKNAFLPPARTILHPALVDIPANKNFAGIPIVPGNLQNLSPQNQYDSNTSGIAKGIGQLTGKSPKQIDYLLSSYGGVLGQLGIPATAPNSTIGETLKKQVTADPVFSNDITSNFYNIKDKLDRAQADFGATGNRPKNYNNALRLYFGRVSKHMSDLRKQIRQIQNSSAPKEQKLQQVREIQSRINDLAQMANQKAGVQ